MARQLSLPDIARLRLHAQGIVASASQSPVNSVRSMLAMQGQDLPGTLWAIGLRSHSTETEVRAAFDRGDLVRSWPMRGTLHALTPDDLRVLLPLSRDRLIASLAARHRELGITPGDVSAARDAAELAMTAETPALTRQELFAVFERAGQSTTGQRGAHLIFMLAHVGQICLGPFRGREQQFVLLDEWAPASLSLPNRVDALAAIALRYFTSHGPATVGDFAWWTKLTLTDARAAVAAVRTELSSLTVNDVEYFAAPQTGQSQRAGPRRVFALPGFDEFLLGYGDRSAALAAEHAQLIVPGNNGVFRPTVVAGGRVVGTWTRKDRARTIDVTARLFRALTEADTQKLRRSLDGYGRFRDKAVTLTIVVNP